MLLRKKGCRKGFTLIEVLIVAVIIAALAAMIIPRFVGQVDRAKAAETLQLVGVIRRAAEQTRAMTGSYGDGFEAESSDNPDNIIDYQNWTKIGLKPFGDNGLLPAGTGDIYYYGDGTDYYQVNVWKSSGYVYYSYNVGADFWTCGGVFKNKVTGDTTTPCVLK